MATRFRKHRTRKMKGRKGLKTRRHRGGSLTRYAKEAMGAVGNAAKKAAVSLGVRESNLDRMFREQANALAKINENKKRAEAAKKALNMYKKR